MAEPKDPARARFMALTLIRWTGVGLVLVFITRSFRWCCLGGQLEIAWPVRAPSLSPLFVT